MEDTFTYTARSALIPEKAVTFTLYDHEMTVDVGAPMEQIERVLENVGGEPEDEERSQPKRAFPLMPTTVSLMERVGRPFDIGDVSAKARNGGLVVTSWVRAKGLRLAPVRFAWEQVDNPQGAQLFSEEVTARKKETSRPGRFRGVMDYWASWLVLGVVLLALLLPRRQEAKQDTAEA